MSDYRASKIAEAVCPHLTRFEDHDDQRPSNIMDCRILPKWTGTNDLPECRYRKDQADCPVRRMYDSMRALAAGDAPRGKCPECKHWRPTGGDWGQCHAAFPSAQCNAHRSYSCDAWEAGDATTVEQRLARILLPLAEKVHHMAPYSTEVECARDLLRALAAGDASKGGDDVILACMQCGEFVATLADVGLVHSCRECLDKACGEGGDDDDTTGQHLQADDGRPGQREGGDVAQPAKGGDAGQPERACWTCEWGPNTVDCGYFQGDHCSDPSGEDSRQYVTPGKHWQPSPAGQPEPPLDCVQDNGEPCRPDECHYWDPEDGCTWEHPRPAARLAEEMLQQAAEWQQCGWASAACRAHDWISRVRALQAERAEAAEAEVETLKRTETALLLANATLTREHIDMQDRVNDLESRYMGECATHRATAETMGQEKRDLEARLAAAIEQRDRWNAASVEAHKRIAEMEVRLGPMTDIWPFVVCEGETIMDAIRRDAVEFREMQARVAELEARLARAVMLPDLGEKLHCTDCHHEQAWAGMACEQCGHPVWFKAAIEAAEPARICRLCRQWSHCGFDDDPELGDCAVHRKMRKTTDSCSRWDGRAEPAGAQKETRDADDKLAARFDRPTKAAREIGEGSSD